MAESNRDLLHQLESRILNSRILLEGKHRWLRPDEICEVLRNPNGVVISEEPTLMPSSGSIFLFDKKVQKHFRNDGYKWKKAKDGRIKEGHEKLKVEGRDTLHCYYAHGEKDQNFQRRSYWMLDENLSHMVLVHYRDVKGEKRKDRYIEETETAEGVQHSHETNETAPHSEMDNFASFSFNPSNFQHSQATDGTNLNSALTSESETTESAYNQEASFGLPPLPKLQHDTLIHTNCNEREVKEAVSSCFVPTNFQMLSQAIDTESLSGLSTSDFEDAQSGFFDNTVTAGLSGEIGPSFVDTTSLYRANSSNFGDDETAWTFSRASSSVAVEPSPLGKRQRDSTASEEGKSQATHNATMEEVDKEKDEEEEGNDINQVRKQPKVTCGQKSNCVAPSNDSEEATLAVGTAPPQVQEFNFAVQQGEVIARNNPAASDGVTNDATALSQSLADDFWKILLETSFDNRVTAGFPPWTYSRASSSVAVEPSPLGKRQRDSTASEERKSQAAHNATMEEVDKEKDEEEVGNDINQVRKRPKFTCGQKSNSVAPSNDSEEATLAVGTAPTQVQEFNFAIQQGEVIAGNNPATSGVALTVDRAITDGAMNDVTALSQDDETTRLAAFHIADPTVAATSAIGPIHLNPYTIANVVDQAQDPQPTVTTGIVVSATTNETATSKPSNHALVQGEPTSNANQDFAQDVVESQEKGTEPTSIEPENGKSKAVVQRDFGTGKSHKFSEVVVTSSHKRLLELLDRASAPNTLASSSSSTPTIDSQAIATTRATLEMDFITMAGEVERTHMISCIQCLIDSNCFPTGTRPMTLAMLKQLEQSVPAYSEAYSEYDMGKNLTDQVEATKQLLQPKVQFCDSKNRESLELEEKKMKIEARQAAIQAEIDGAVKETEPIQACLEKLLQKQDQFKKNEGNLKNILDIGDGLWTTLKSIIHRHLPM